MPPDGSPHDAFEPFWDPEEPPAQPPGTDDR